MIAVRPGRAARTETPAMTYNTVSSRGELNFSLPSGLSLVAGQAPEESIQAGEYLVFDVVQEGDEYIATEPQSGMYGEGGNAMEAARSLLSSLRNLRDELRADAKNLAPELQADLAFLDQVLWD